MRPRYGMAAVLAAAMTTTLIGASAAAPPPPKPPLPAPAKAKAGLLDGMVFAGEAGEKGKPANEKDEIVFEGGKFRSRGCDPYGFTPAPYTATVSGDVTSFEADSTSTKEGTIHWKGTVKGDTVEVTYVWTKSGQAPIEYWYKGKLKQAAS